MEVALYVDDCNLNHLNFMPSIVSAKPVPIIYCDFASTTWSIMVEWMQMVAPFSVIPYAFKAMYLTFCNYIVVVITPVTLFSFPVFGTQGKLSRILLAATYI